MEGILAARARVASVDVGQMAGGIDLWRVVTANPTSTSQRPAPTRRFTGIQSAAPVRPSSNVQERVRVILGGPEDPRPNRVRTLI